MKLPIKKMLSEILFLLEKYLTKEVQLRQVSKKIKNSYEMYMKRISLYVDDIKLAKYFTSLGIKINFKGMNYINLNINFIYSLNLSGTKVTDVSMLGNVHKLNLSNTQVTDVSMLGNVHKLNLSNTQVTDVSMLGNVHTLDLCNTQVTDVSMLGNVHTLDLSLYKSNRCVYVGECTYIKF